MTPADAGLVHNADATATAWKQLPSTQVAGGIAFDTFSSTVWTSPPQRNSAQRPHGATGAPRAQRSRRDGQQVSRRPGQSLTGRPDSRNERRRSTPSTGISTSRPIAGSSPTAKLLNTTGPAPLAFGADRPRRQWIVRSHSCGSLITRLRCRVAKGLASPENFGGVRGPLSPPVARSVGAL